MRTYAAHIGTYAPCEQSRHTVPIATYGREDSPLTRSLLGGVRHWTCGCRLAATLEAHMARKDKGGRSSKKVAAKSLKEKRAAKKAKKAN